MTRRFIAAVSLIPKTVDTWQRFRECPGWLVKAKPKKRLTKALEFHLESMAEFGEEVPGELVPTSTRAIELAI